MTNAIVHVSPRILRLDLDSFARAAGLHPTMVRRLVALGLLEPYQDATGALWFSTAQIATVARMQRLRAGFSINYASLSLVLHLLDRIEGLEAALRTAERASLWPADRAGGRSSSRPTSRSNGGRQWT